MKNQLLAQQHSVNIRPARRILQLRSRLDIKPAKPYEMPIAADIVRSSAKWYLPFIHERDRGQHIVSQTWGETEFARRQFYIGRNNDVPVGIVSTQSVDNLFYIGYLYLYADQVGRGFGPQLLNHARDIALQEKKRGMLLMVHPKATWAINAYIRYGFECVATTRKQVLDWHHGWLKPYYEEDFQMYRLLF
jgi:GNAT superfamily N-acetyltransferase